MTHIYISSVIDAPVSSVWSVIRDFNGLPAWVPAVAESRIEDGLNADSVGCVRAFRLHDDGRLRERLLALSDVDLSCTYSILESPMPLENYEATLRIMPITDTNRTFAQWTADFDCAASDEAALIEQIGQGVFQAAFDSLKSWNFT